MALQIRLRSAKSKPPDNHQGNERPPAQQQKFTELEHEGKRWQRMTVLLVVVIGVALLGGVVMLARTPPPAKRKYRQPPRTAGHAPPAPVSAASHGAREMPAPPTPTPAPPAAPSMPAPAVAATAAASAAPSIPTQLANGDFELGNLQGWVPSGLGGGVVQLVQAGSRFPGGLAGGQAATDTDQVPFQGGQWAVSLRSSGAGMAGGAAAILTSEPVRITRNRLRWDQMAEAEQAVTEVRILDSNTGVELSTQRFSRSRPRSIRNDVYWERMTVDLTRIMDRTVRVQLRQYTEYGDNGWFTLLDNVALE